MYLLIMTNTIRENTNDTRPDVFAKGNYDHKTLFTGISGKLVGLLKVHCKSFKMRHICFVIYVSEFILK